MHQCKRADPQVREAEQELDTAKCRQKRKEPDERSKENEYEKDVHKNITESN